MRAASVGPGSKANFFNEENGSQNSHGSVLPLNNHNQKATQLQPLILSWK